MTLNSSGISPDLYLAALCVVIWVVAISVAFTFYIPVLRGRKQPPRRSDDQPKVGGSH